MVRGDDVSGGGEGKGTCPPFDAPNSMNSMMMYDPPRGRGPAWDARSEGGRNKRGARGLRSACYLVRSRHANGVGFVNGLQPPHFSFEHWRTNIPVGMSEETGVRCQQARRGRVTPVRFHEEGADIRVIAIRNVDAAPWEHKWSRAGLDGKIERSQQRNECESSNAMYEHEEVEGLPATGVIRVI